MVICDKMGCVNIQSVRFVKRYDAKDYSNDKKIYYIAIHFKGDHVSLHYDIEIERDNMYNRIKAELERK